MHHFIWESEMLIGHSFVKKHWYGLDIYCQTLPKYTHFRTSESHCGCSC